MALAVGSRLGSYDVVGALGAGSMGEVYRAVDTRLDRQVAIKILPEAVRADPERTARFEREAKLLASLNHPNIAGIYGLERVNDEQFIVMELVEGETLADQIVRGPIPVSDALQIAKQIADALEAAHEAGVIHRDLKPANVKVRPDGAVKVLDFGLAKALGGDPLTSPATLTNSPTLTSPVGVTGVGTLLGTAAYMSPEQAKGKTADKRSDVWAFGCVLYEMLAGKRAFVGETLSDTLAAILERAPEWAALPHSTPPTIRRLLTRCLDKDLKRRLRDIGEARIELTDASAIPVAVAGAVDARRPRMWAFATVLVLCAGIGGVTVAWRVARSTVNTPPSVIRTTVMLPANQRLEAGRNAASLALSPDGKRIAYVAYAQGRTSLYVRNIEAFDPRSIPDTAGAQYPFFSPDGQWVGFFSERKLKRVSIAGGAPVFVCDAPVVGRGGTWSPDGTIVFDAGSSGLMKVAAAGGVPERFGGADGDSDSEDHEWPRFLPDGRSVVVTRRGPQLAVVSLKTGEWRVIGPGSQGQYLPSGHLLFHADHVREGELHAVPFDLTTLTIRGTAVSVFDHVFRAPSGGAAYFAISDNGTLVFAPGGLAHSLVQVDRAGRRSVAVADQRGFRFPRYSPDGSQVAVTIDPRPSAIWVYDLVRGSGGPLTMEGHSLHALWTRDGQRVAYGARGDIYWRDADGRSDEQLLLARELPQYPQSWSPDGQLLFYDQAQPDGGIDIWVLPLGGEPRPVLASPAREEYPTVSPDGRWLAYHSNESGRFEVYVRPLPNVSRGKWTISAAGGHSPVWSRKGDELFYLDGTVMMAVRVVAKGAVFVPGMPKVLFDGPFDTTQLGNYDVSPDGTRFIMVQADPDATPNRINVVQHFDEELKRLVPSN